VFNELVDDEETRMELRIFVCRAKDALVGRGMIIDWRFIDGRMLKERNDLEQGMNVHKTMKNFHVKTKKRFGSRETKKR